MLALRLPDELEAELNRVAKETRRSKSYYVREALKAYLEDRRDYLDAVAALEKAGPTYSLKEMEKRLGLDD
ncbi:MAG: antitoxin [marine bacterium B5-7]|nr:MAG: antitoxin [marine bacterium B5-7]